MALYFVQVAESLLRIMREEAKLTQIQLSQKLGRPQSYVSKVETGERSLHLNELFDYSHAMGFSAQEVISRIERKYPFK